MRRDEQSTFQKSRDRFEFNTTTTAVTFPTASPRARYSLFKRQWISPERSKVNFRIAKNWAMFCARAQAHTTTSLGSLVSRACVRDKYICMDTCVPATERARVRAHFAPYLCKDNTERWYTWRLVADKVQRKRRQPGALFTSDRCLRVPLREHACPAYAHNARYAYYKYRKFACAAKDKDRESRMRQARILTGCPERHLEFKLLSSLPSLIFFLRRRSFRYSIISTRLGTFHITFRLYSSVIHLSERLVDRRNDCPVSTNVCLKNWSCKERKLKKIKRKRNKRCAARW